MKDTPNKVPRADSALAAYWIQPPRELVVLDAVHALMTQKSFDTLQDCTGTRPALTFAGQMWRVQFGGKWWLMWYEPAVIEPAVLIKQWRELLIVE